MIGRKVGVGLERRNGRHWLGNVLAQSETPGLELNDLGRLNMSDSNSLAAAFDAARRGRDAGSAHVFDESLQSDRREPKAATNSAPRRSPQVQLTWRNFWVTNFTGDQLPRAGHAAHPRRPLMEAKELAVPVRRSQQRGLSNQGSLDFRCGKTEDGGLTARADTSITTQPMPRWLLS